MLVKVGNTPTAVPKEESSQLRHILHIPHRLLSNLNHLHLQNMAQEPTMRLQALKGIFYEAVTYELVEI